jgi:hypothetical protein
MNVQDFRFIRILKENFMYLLIITFYIIYFITFTNIYDLINFYITVQLLS